jgi:cysteine/O-acetylserine efflux protein
MILTAFISYLPYALITTFTPGRNNLISFSPVSSHGWRKGLSVLAGIGTAIMLIMVIAAVFCHQLSAHVEAVLPVLKYFGAAYILWLAWQIARSGPDNTAFNIASYWKGFFLVFINIKMLLYALTIFSSYIIDYSTELPFLLLQALILTGLCILSNFTWAAAGSALQKFMNRHYRPFNITMAIVLAYCAITLVTG